MFKFILLFVSIVFSKKTGGTYRYVNRRSKRTHYVGATNDFSRRHSEHINNNDYYTGNDYKIIKNYMKNNVKNMANTERNLIKKHNPVANRNKGGGGL